MTFKHRQLNKLFLLGLFLLLAACGFHLAGKVDFPHQFNHVYISSKTTYSPIARELADSLTASGVILTDNPTSANYTINLTNESQGSSLLGSGSTQETRKYNISYSVTFAILDKDKKVIYGPSNMSASSAIYIYSGQVLGNNNETATIAQQLQREVVQKLMLKLSSTSVSTILTRASIADTPVDVDTAVDPESTNPTESKDEA